MGIDLGDLARDAKQGDSVALSGACATIEKIQGNICVFFLGEETLEITWFGHGLKPGVELNVERALSVGARIGGHIVQGHVDGVGEVASWKNDRGQGYFRFVLDERLYPYVVKKGSIAVDGVSLTVAEIEEKEVGVFLVPFTTSNTTLGKKKPGEPLNIEVDILGKYVEKQVEAFLAQRKVEPST